MPLYVFLIQVWLAKISFSNLISIKVIEEKPLGVGSSPLPPPLDQEGLTLSFCLLAMVKMTVDNVFMLEWSLASCFITDFPFSPFLTGKLATLYQ